MSKNIFEDTGENKVSEKTGKLEKVDFWEYKGWKQTKVKAAEGGGESMLEEEPLINDVHSIYNRMIQTDELRRAMRQNVHANNKNMAEVLMQTAEQAPSYLENGDWLRINKKIKDYNDKYNKMVQLVGGSHDKSKQ